MSVDTNRVRRQKTAGTHGRFGELRRDEPALSLHPDVTASGPLIPGMGEVVDNRALNATLDRCINAYSTADEYERDESAWAAERSLEHFDDVQFNEHWTRICRYVDTYGDMSVPVASAVDATIEAHDEARAAKGISIVDDYLPPNSTRPVNGYGPSATEGEHYDQNMDVKTVAKNIRAELKKAQIGGWLPDNLDYSVRIDRFAGGQAVRIGVDGLTDDQLRCEDDNPNNFGSRRTDEAAELSDRITQIGEAWNRDDSDTMTDYFSNHYYLSVNLNS